MAIFEIRRSPTEIARVRDRVRLLPEMTDLDHTTTDDVVLIVSELVSNAVSAARPESTITIEVDRCADGIHISVENLGPPLEGHDDPHLPDSSAMRGRGLAIVSMLSSSMTTDHHGGRTRVSVVCARAATPS
jgi:anti-sigma regulatory factor (Ser/Thr protein kinase)